MADLSILSQLQGIRINGLVVDVGVNSRTAAGDRAGGIGNQCAIFGGSYGSTIDGNRVADAAGDSLSLGGDCRLNLPQQVTTFAVAFFLFQFCDTLLQCCNLRRHLCELGSTVATAAAASL